MKSGNLYFLEPSGPLQACNGTALPLLKQKTIVLPCGKTEKLQTTMIIYIRLIWKYWFSAWRASWCTLVLSFHLGRQFCLPQTELVQEPVLRGSGDVCTSGKLLTGDRCLTKTLKLCGRYFGKLWTGVRSRYIGRETLALIVTSGHEKWGLNALAGDPSGREASGWVRSAAPWLLEAWVRIPLNASLPLCWWCR